MLQKVIRYAIGSLYQLTNVENEHKLTGLDFFGEPWFSNGKDLKSHVNVSWFEDSNCFYFIFPTCFCKPVWHKVDNF